MAKSIPDQLSMFNPEICEGSSSATSSPASGDGPMRSDSQAGPMIGTSGPEVVLASRGAWREKAKVSTIRAIFGQRGSGSLPSADLQSSLENRLRASTAFTGSILYTPAWKHRTTPSGRRILAVRASARRTSGPAYGSWPTPTALSFRDSHTPGQNRYTVACEAILAGWNTPNANEQDEAPEVKDARNERHRAAGKSKGVGSYKLSTQVQLAGWATPIVNDATGSQYAYSRGDHSRPYLKLPGEAMLAGWPTPNTPSGGRSMSPDKMDSSGRTVDGRKHTASLEHAVKFAAWPTPTARDWKSEVSSEEWNRMRWEHPRGKTLSATACLADSGETVNGSIAGQSPVTQRAAGGRLNPAHSRWLQGYPPAFCDCAVTATASNRTLRRSSSRRISKPRRSDVGAADEATK